MEASGRAFERLSAELSNQRLLAGKHAAQAALLRGGGACSGGGGGRAFRCPRAGGCWACHRDASQARARRCRQLGRELEQLRPRLGYEFNLPSDASLAIIGQLGKARCRAARACQGLRAAVGSAKRLGAFKHRVLAITAGGYVPAHDPEQVGTGRFHYHTVVCTRDAVFSFGDGPNGQLGHGHASTDTKPSSTPRVVAALLGHDIVKAAASSRGTLVCNDRGRVYWTGYLPGCGKARTTIVGEYTITMPALKLPPPFVPRLVEGLERVVGVAAGQDHLLAWTGAGELYTWGRGSDGQLGHGGEEAEPAPRLVKALMGQRVVGADGANVHSVVRTANGRLYTFGEGRERLGHGQDAPDTQTTPKLVEGLAGSTVVAVAAGNFITAAVTEAGELYTWGISIWGGLGHGEGVEEVPLPRLVAGLPGKRVAGVAAGHEHTMAWTDAGELYSWGHGEGGQLGHNSTQNEYSPRRVQALAGKAVVGACAPFIFSVVTTRDDQVYTFGDGTKGQLGYKKGSRQLVPRRVEGLSINLKAKESCSSTPLVACRRS